MNKVHCARNLQFLAQFLQALQVSCKKGDIFSARLVHRMCKHLQDNFPWALYCIKTKISEELNLMNCKISKYYQIKYFSKMALSGIARPFLCTGSWLNMMKLISAPRAKLCLSQHINEG